MTVFNMSILHIRENNKTIYMIDKKLQPSNSLMRMIVFWMHNEYKCRFHRKIITQTLLQFQNRNEQISIN